MDSLQYTQIRAAGRLGTADCRDSILVFTSNVDCNEMIQEARNQDAWGDQDAMNKICRDHLVASGVRPELVGRIGCFLLFKELDGAARADIVALSIIDVAKEYDVNVKRIEPTVITSLLDQCPACSFGARPVRNSIEELLAPAFERAQLLPGRTEAQVNGPPYTCVPWHAGESGSQSSAPPDPAGELHTLT